MQQAFRRELLRVLNRGESINSLKRSIYVGRVAGYQAKHHDEMQAVADALSLLANLVMAWNTMKMQLVLDRWNTRRSTTVPPELIGRIAPTRTEASICAACLAFPSSNTLIAAVTGGNKITGYGCLNRPKMRRENHFLAQQKSPLNQCVVMLYPEISRENGGLPTGTFGTEIKVTPSCRPNRNLWSNLCSQFDILFEEGAQMNALEKKERNPAWNLPVYRP